jgi:ribulose-phosphate 3-epimerase
MIEFSLMCLQRHQMPEAAERILPLVDSLHFDIMDQKFVPTQAFSTDFVTSFSTNLPKHVHIMAYDPLQYLDALEDVTSVSFHLEAVDDPEIVAGQIKARGFMAGICINPDTSVDHVAPLVSELDRIVVMAVTPGYSGQKYIPHTSRKLIELRRLAPHQQIVIDGGMHEDTIREVMTLGASSVVVCSVVVLSPDWEAKAHELRESGNIGATNKRILNTTGDNT